MGIELRRGDYQHPVDSGKTGLCSHARRGSHRTLEERRIDSRKGAKPQRTELIFAALRLCVRISPPYQTTLGAYSSVAINQPGVPA